MATGVFNKNVLNDNWFEDRLAPEGSLDVTSGLTRKTARPPETDLAYVGERYDVLARISRIPARPSFALPDDGFNETVRSSAIDFADPRTRKEVKGGKAEAPKLINTLNAPVLPPEKRALDGPERGFGSALPQHPANHEQRLWSTSVGEFFGESLSRLKPARLDPGHPELQAAGMSTEHEEARIQGLKVGVLCGENFNNSADPGLNSRTQRSWLYQPDASLRHIEEFGGLKRNLPPSDNELSLPLGNGAMSKVRADLKERQGRLFRTATYITKGKGQRGGISIFQDY